tara:strand:- start:16225 stop:16743 length:519 start_codon:yes stop_codon:yes gene_type:complete
MTDTDRPIVRAALESDAASLAILGERLAESDPYLVVSGFDPVTGVTLLKGSTGAAAQAQTSQIFVAEHDGELAGLAICRCHPPPERDTVLQLDLGVDSRYRRHGLGSALIRHSLFWAQEVGLHRVQLAVVAENKAAIAVYEKHGFEIEGTLRKGFRLAGQLHDVHVMARLLR